MNSVVIHSLFHVILPNIRYIRLILHSPQHVRYRMCYVSVFMCMSETVCNVHTMAYYYDCVAITILRLKTNCINQYVLFMRKRMRCVYVDNGENPVRKNQQTISSDIFNAGYNMEFNIENDHTNESNA